MLVQCPKCRTLYKVADDLLKGSVPSFRCSRCKHTFEPEAQNASKTPGPSGTPAERAGPEDELRLPLDAKDDGGAEAEAEAPAPVGEEATRSESQWAASAPLQDTDEDRFVMPERDPAIEPSEPRGATPDFPAYDRLFPALREDSDDPNNILAISSYREQKASVLPFLTLFGLLVIVFALISAIHYTKPEAFENVIKSTPVLGAAILKNSYLKDGILIESLRSGYQTIQGNREVFLVSGTAINENPVVVREIQLTAVAYDEEGKELETQMIWVGNTISPKIIRGMTIEDIPHLQDLKPLKSFEIPPGDSVPFTVVFLKSAKNVKSFTCEVVAAEAAI